MKTRTREIRVRCTVVNCCPRPKRNAVLTCGVQRYGTDSYGDADYVSIYGMRLLTVC